MHSILWFSFVSLVGVYLMGPLIDPDLWWHLVVGKWIVANQSIPTVDYWNMFGISKPWRAYSWSNEIVLALTELGFGLKGLSYLKLLLGFGVAFSFCYYLSKIAKDWAFGALFGAVVVGSCVYHYTLRPQSFIWILFIALFYFLDKIRTQGSSISSLVSIFTIMALWANTHITTVIALAAIFAWLFPSSLCSKNVNRKTLMSVLIVGVLGLLCTPYFGGELVTFANKISHPLSHDTIAEFQPANIMQFPTGFLLILVTLLLLLVRSNPKVLSPLQLLFALGLALGSLAVIKFVPIATISLSACIAYQWKHRSQKDKKQQDGGGIQEGIERLIGGIYGLPVQGLTFVVLSMLAVTAFDRSLAFGIKRDTPSQAIDFMQKHALPEPILNIFGDGGYLMYRYANEKGEPSILVPIDGRTNVGSPEVSKAHDEAISGSIRWKSYLDQVEPNTILWRTEAPLTSILLEREEWCRVFSQGNGERAYSVFVKKEIIGEDCRLDGDKELSLLEPAR